MNVPSYIPTLTGIRFFAATAVVALHYQASVALLFPSIALVAPLIDAGYLGVDLFFILSGFILTFLYGSSFQYGFDVRRYLHFLGLRLARIYPIHVFLLGVLLSAYAGSRLVGLGLRHAEAFTVEDLVRSLLLVHAWTFEHVGQYLAWNWPSWSISAEWFAYLLFPLVAPLALSCSPRLAFVVAGAALAVQLVLMNVVNIGDVALLRIAGEFTCGAFLASSFLGNPSVGRRWDTVAIGAGVASLILAIALPRVGLDRSWLVPCLAILIYACARAVGPVRSLLSTPLLQAWGDASYAVYMIHGVVGILGSRLLPFSKYTDADLAIRVAVLCTYLVAIFGGAWLLHLLVERPARRQGRHLLVKLLGRPQGRGSSLPSSFQ